MSTAVIQYKITDDLGSICKVQEMNVNDICMVANVLRIGVVANTNVKLKN